MLSKDALLFIYYTIKHHIENDPINNFNKNYVKRPPKLEAALPKR